MLSNIQPFLSETQRRAFAEAESRGEARGEAKAKAENILKILAKRGLALAEVHRERVLGCTDLAALDRWFDRALTVTTVDELFE
jgi:hypothetical protein